MPINTQTGELQRELQSQTVERDGHPQRTVGVTDTGTNSETTQSTQNRTEPTTRTTRNGESSVQLNYTHYSTGLRLKFSIPLRSGTAIVQDGETAPAPLV
jgi:hypothetical protein